MQRPDEKLDDFANICRQIARKWEFDAKELDERILEQIIASTPITEFQKELLVSKKGFTLNDALQLGRTYEASKSHIQTLQSLYHNSHIDAVQQQRRTQSVCKNCGKQHRFGKEHCPAADIICFSCNKVIMPSCAYLRS